MSEEEFKKEIRSLKGKLSRERGKVARLEEDLKDTKTDLLFQAGKAADYERMTKDVFIAIRNIMEEGENKEWRAHTW